MYSTTLVGRECRKFGSSWSRERPASAPVLAGRGRDVRDVGGVRDHRVRAAEPGDVALLGQDQVQVTLGEAFGRVDGGRGRRAQQRGQPRLGTERGGGVLVYVPDHGRPPAPGRQGEQQLRIVDQQQVGTGALPGQLAPGGKERAEPAPAAGTRYRRDLQQAAGPFGIKRI
jgi:hypothetical protein